MDDNRLKFPLIGTIALTLVGAGALAYAFFGISGDVDSHEPLSFVEKILPGQTAAGQEQTTAEQNTDEEEPEEEVPETELLAQEIRELAAEKASLLEEAPVTLQLSSEVTETVPADTVRAWIAVSEDPVLGLSYVLVDKAQIRSYVDGIAQKYDTVGQTADFTTTGGEELHYTTTNYGWRIDRSATTDSLTSAFENMGALTPEAFADLMESADTAADTAETEGAENTDPENATEAAKETDTPAEPDTEAAAGTPSGSGAASMRILRDRLSAAAVQPAAALATWSSKGSVWGENTIGSSYVEIDLTQQHVWVYRGGEVAVSTDCVTGKAISGNNTPNGIFAIQFKQRDAILRGEDYETPVSYWMPIFQGVGLHDAGWRGSFGGDIYVRSGSHGCVNLPPSAAAQIFEVVYSGEPVIVYGGMNQAQASEYAAAKDAEKAAQEQANAQWSDILEQLKTNYMALGLSEEEAAAQAQADINLQLAEAQAQAAAGAEAAAPSQEPAQ